MSICGGSISFFSTSSWSYESCFSSNSTKFPISRPNFPGVNLNTWYNNPTIFSLTTTNYLHCLQKCKPTNQNLSLIDVDKCVLKLNANATLKNLKTKVNTKARRLSRSRSSHTFIIPTPIHFIIPSWPKRTWFNNLWSCPKKVPFM